MLLHQPRALPAVQCGTSLKLCPHQPCTSQNLFAEGDPRAGAHSGGRGHREAPEPHTGWQPLWGQLEPPKSPCQAGLELGGVGGKGADVQPPSFPFQALPTVTRALLLLCSAVSSSVQLLLLPAGLSYRLVYFGLWFPSGTSGHRAQCDIPGCHPRR